MIPVKRYKIGPNKNYKYSVTEEPANGLMLRVRAGESLMLKLGDKEVEIIIWSSNCNNHRICLRSKEKFEHAPDREEER